jgi:AbrB family looped-hinge helix DNA binding protein
MADDQGNTQVPEEIRKRLNLKKGDRVEYFVKPDGEIVFRLVPASVAALRGILHRPGLPPRTIKQMREGMMEFLAEEDERIKRGEE